MVDKDPCAGIIEDPIIKDLMFYCQEVNFPIAKKENGEPYCGDLHFVFHFPYKERSIKIIVERNGDRIVRQGQLKSIDNLHTTNVGDFLNEIGNPNNQFLPGIIVEKDEQDNIKRYAIVRADIEIDEEFPHKNRLRFMESMLRLKQQLDQLPYFLSD